MMMMKKKKKRGRRRRRLYEGLSIISGSAAICTAVVVAHCNGRL
jgi:hypothetical protein